MNIINAPHPVLQDASFVIAFTGEGAAAYVVHGGWRAMLLRFAQETIDYTLTDLPDAAHVNAEEWQGHWMARFHDLDEWTGDESSQPYHFGSEVGEISRVSIYRLVQALPAASPPPQSAQLIEPFQQRVEPWLLACFGPEIAGDTMERNHRFLEESLELVQACGCTASEAHQLVDYTFGRAVGQKHQEAGGVMVTLAALCRAQGIDMHAEGETELARIWTMVEKIRAKQAAKPKHSPLPEAAGSGLMEGKDAVRDVLAERQRQVTAEGYFPAHDDEHDKGELAVAAACYALRGNDPTLWITAGQRPCFGSRFLQRVESWVKSKNRRSNLVRAAALLLAEIERLDRAALSQGQQTEQGSRNEAKS